MKKIIFPLLLLFLTSNVYGMPQGIEATNFDEVLVANEEGVPASTGIYRGGEPSNKDLVKLAEYGIKTIVDFRIFGVRKERKEVERLGMKYFNIPWEPDWYLDIFFDYQKISDKFMKIIENPDHLPIYVHCRVGRDRTGSMFATYRMKHQGWTADEALNEMKKYGFDGKTYFNLVNFVQKYGQSLHP